MQESPIVLVADDEAIVLNFIGLVLRQAGFRVLRATGGSQALELVRKSEEPVTLAVIDMVMPDISGPDLFARLREIYPGIRVLFISGYNAPLRGCRPAADFLEKPFTANGLLRRFRETAERQPPPGVTAGARASVTIKIPLSLWRCASTTRCPNRSRSLRPASDNTVRMYTCGPTVYDFAHIGNFRTFTFYDLLRRWLRASGFQLDHVMNITDVDDKIIRNAVAQHKSLDEYTAIYTRPFWTTARLLRLERPERLARATEHIHEMAEAIEQLGDKGPHLRERRVGLLPHRQISRVRQALAQRFQRHALAGARVDVDEYEKADARDFALWKAPKEGEPFWDTTIGPGRPGWHIECSVMAIKYLGETLDIHAGGIDLVFPHHENEIAQSEALTGKPFSRFWLHAEFLLVEGQKMSKSLGNYYTLRDIWWRKGYQPEAVRYLLASVPYRKALNFTFGRVEVGARPRSSGCAISSCAWRRTSYPEGDERAAGGAHRAGVAGVRGEPGRRSEYGRGAGRGVRIRARRQHRDGCGRFPRRQCRGGAGVSGAVRLRSSTC